MSSVKDRVSWTKPTQIEIEWPAGHTAATFGKPNQQRDYHGRWGKGGSPSTSDDSIAVAKRTSYSEWGDDIDEINKKNATSFSGDQQLREIWKTQGFDGKPTGVSKEEFDAGTGSVLYRGIAGDKHKERCEQFISGEEPFPGFGNYGNGTYTSNDIQTAKDYTGASTEVAHGKTGSYIRMRLKPNARVISNEDLNKRMRDEMNVVTDLGKQKKFNEMMKHTQLISKLGNPGHAASALGYDAIDVAERGYVVVLNRTAVTVDKTVYGGEE